MTTYKKVCLDAVSPEVDGPALARTLGLPWRPDERGEGGLMGPQGHYLVWVNAVPGVDTKSERVRLDIRSRRWRGIVVASLDPLAQATWWARVLEGTSQADETADIDELIALGATLVRPRDYDRPWTVLADPEGNEFCAFPA